MQQKAPASDDSIGRDALVLGCTLLGSTHRSENKNASNSRQSLWSVARSYQHKALGELHRQ